MVKRSWFLLGAAWLLVALVTKTLPESGHEYSRMGTVQSIVEHGTYQLDESSFINTIDKVYRNGHYYSHQPPLLPTLEAPIYWVLRLPGLRFNNRTREITVFLFSLLTNGLALALTVVLFGRIFAMAGVPSPANEVYALVLPFGTWLLPYAVVSTSHGISGFLLAAVVWLLLSVEWRGATSARCAWLGAALGLLSAIELLPLASFLPLTIVYLWTRRDLSRASWRAFALGVSAPLLAHCAINIPITGDIIPAGFHHELFNYPGSAFDETSLTGSIKYHSLRDAATYAWEALFAGKGYFTFAPVLLLGLVVGTAGWRWWGRARGPQLVLIGGIVASLAASLLTTNNFGGTAVGFRHATYLAPAMLALLLPVFVDRRPAARACAWAITILAGLSAVTLLLFAVRNPWYALVLPSGPVGTWEDYFPMVFKLATRGLLGPY